MSQAARHREPELPSERSFGLVFAGAFALVGAWPLIHGRAPHLWAFAFAVLLLALALFLPDALRIPNRLWMKFGMLLGKILSPVVMLILFSVVFVPAALILKIRGKDLLRLKQDPAAGSYWIERDPAEAAAQSMRNQF